MTSATALRFRVSISTTAALCAVGAAIIGCSGASDDPTSQSSGGGHAVGDEGRLSGGPSVGGRTAAGGAPAGAGGTTTAQGGSVFSGGGAPPGGWSGSGGALELGGSASAIGGAIGAQGGASMATGGASAGTGGAASTSGGASAAIGGASALTGGASAATGGASTTTGGASAALGGASAATGGASSTTGGTSTTTGGASTSVGGRTAAEGGSPPTGGEGTSEEGGTTAADGGASTAAGGSTAVDIAPDALYVAPDGVQGAEGTLDAPTTLPDALARVSGGGTIFVRGGSYAFDSTVGLSKSGSDGSPITLRAYPLDSERPLLDFSAMSEDSSNRGMSLSGSYWHLYGMDLHSAGDNCMFVSGSNNIIEHMTFSECADTGLQLGGGASNNLVVNCDSYFNADSSLENADGFAAKLDVGTDNRFVGCRAWNNLDDGWDGYLRPADDITTTYENCWAIDNGKLMDGSVGAGDGNGFKTGGSDDKALRHNAIYERCISAGNVNDGFDHNSNRGSVTILNSAAHGNGNNINFSSSNIAASLSVKNTISLGNNGSLEATRTDITNNSWQGGLSASADDFISVDTSLLKSPRKSDGSLPDIDYLKLKDGSGLRNAGIDVGLPFSGSAPDLGPFESSE